MKAFINEFFSEIEFIRTWYSLFNRSIKLKDLYLCGVSITFNVDTFKTEHIGLSDIEINNS